MKLRNLTRSSAAVLVVVTVVTLGGLLLVTSYLHRLTDRVGQNMEGIRAAAEVELQLLWHGRASYLRTIVDEQRYNRLAAEAREELAYWQDAAAEGAEGPEETAVVADMRARIQQYLSAYDRLVEQGASQPAVYQEVAPLLLEASSAAEELIAVNVEQASVSREQARHWGRVATLAGIGVGIVLIAGLGWLVVGFDVWLLRPLRHLSGAIASVPTAPAGLQIREEGPEELREVARVLGDMVAELERYRRARLQALAGVAHDLRNPLSAMSYALARVPPAVPDAPEARVRSTLEIVARQVDLLARMVSDLLDSSRLEAGQLALAVREADLAGLARQVVDLFRPVSQRHEVRLHVPDEPLLLRCDPLRVVQVLNNLVSNAIKYSPEGGVVDVMVERRDDAVVLSVGDEGLGIPPEERQTIFEPFRRGQTSREAIPGVGLGLSMARRIVEAHGGRIEARPREGGGSLFEVTLPRDPADGRAPG